MNRYQFLQTLAFASEFRESEFAGNVRENSIKEDAKRALAGMRLSEIAKATDAEDDLSILLGKSVHKMLARELASLTVATINRFLLSSSADLWWQRYRDGLSSEAIAAIVKVMTDDELSVIASRYSNPLAARPGEIVAIGSANHLGSRLQANSPRDDEQEVLFSILEGLSYGCGDVLLSLKPASENPESVLHLGQLLSQIIDLLKLPTRFSVMTDNCNLASGNSKFRANVTFLKLDGSSAGLKTATGLEAADFVELACNSGDLYFQTGLRPDSKYDTAEKFDLTLAESRAFGLARTIRQKIERGQNRHPWIVAGSAIGQNDKEVFFTGKQMLRFSLEKVAMARLHGLTIGLDVCASFLSGIIPVELRQLTARITEQTSPSFLTATAGNADPLLGYLTTSFREHPRLRRALGKQITSAMQKRLRELGATNPKGEPAAHALTTARLYAQFAQAGGDTRSAETLHAEGLKRLEQLKQRGFDLGYGHSGDYNTPKQVELRLETIYTQARRAIHAVPE